MKMPDVHKLLSAVQQLGRYYGMDEHDVTRAWSLAWYYAQACPKTFPARYWAKVGIRAARNGRDLPGCGTGAADALSRSWLCGHMRDILDRTPGPDALASHREAMERLEASLNPTERAVADLSLEGLSGLEIAERIQRSPGRVSQIKRVVAERWAG